MECEEITQKVIGAFYKVFDELGCGFLERVYIGALKIELDKLGLKSVRELPVGVRYDSVVVGEYKVDLLVEERVLVEVKAIRELSEADERQLLNYLRCTNKEVGLLLNFGSNPEIKRKVYDNGLKRKYC